MKLDLLKSQKNHRISCKTEDGQFHGKCQHREIINQVEQIGP